MFPFPIHRPNIVSDLSKRFEYQGYVQSFYSGTVDLSSYAVAGHFCIILSYVRNGTQATPSGFTLGGLSTGTGDSTLMAAKVLTGSETTVTMVTGTNVQTVALFFAPKNFSIDTFSINDYDGHVTDSTPSAQTLNMLGETDLPIIGVGNLNSSNNIISYSNTGFTEITLEQRARYFYTHYSDADTPANGELQITADPGWGNAIQVGYYTFTQQ